MKEKINNWFKNNWFKIVVIAAILVIFLVTFCFYKHWENTNYQQRAEKCMELGQEYVSNYLKNSGVLVGFPDTELEREYHFNRKLKTCLVYLDVARTINPNRPENNYDLRFVIDILTNKVLIQNSIPLVGATYSKDASRLQFEIQKEILMNE